MIGAFGFQGTDAAFHECVIVGITRTTHRDGDAIVGQEVLVAGAGILPAAVRMMEQGAMRGLALDQGHTQSVFDQCGLQVRGHGPADNLTREHIQHQRQKQPAFQRRDIGDVRDPFFVRPLRVKLALEPVRRDR